LSLDRRWVLEVILHKRDDRGNLELPEESGPDRFEQLYQIARRRGWPEHRAYAWAKEHADK
jgi:hypothetical protein